jgi:hypothetical protein
MRWELQVAYVDEMSKKYRFRVENLKDKSHFGETGIGVKYLKKQDVKKVE